MTAPTPGSQPASATGDAPAPGTDPAASGASPATEASEARPLASTYNPADVEPAIAQRWDDAGVFHAEPDAPGEPFAIVIPPPNVTAALHLGHALNNTLQDILVRYHRMLGRNTMWMPGTDHAGIATQTVVEKRVMQAEGKRRTDFERDAFVEKIQAWKDEYEAFITNQLKQMGCSCDWDRQRFTMDPVCAAAVREAFFRLFADELIYRGKRLVNWDPVTQTALADDEVENQEIDGNFWYLRYPLVDDAGRDTGEHATVATTRPETMLGDTAVAVNPRDPERAGLIGRRVRLPLVNRVVPIVGDDYVVIPDPESDDAKARYASGFLKVTPAHDPNDWQIGLRHHLDAINVMAPDGSISKDHGWPADDFAAGDRETLAALVGLDRYDARRAIVRWFKAHDLLEEVRPYRHSVGHSYRSHVPVEPYLSDQWYVRVTDDRLAGAALRAMAPDQRSESDGCVWKDRGPFDPPADPAAEADADWYGQLRFWPDRYARTFQLWHENIRDWCISRQLWWGHRIPVWSKPVEGSASDLDLAEFAGDFAEQFIDGVRHVCVRTDEATELIELLEASGYRQDPDVLDTWFSSALWPISTLGWPEDNAALRTWNPSNVLCTAREIITLWVSRMVMFNVYFRRKLPFHDVFIHAMIQDGHGQKMSKSLGNGVDPIDIIHSHGADAMRFTLASMTTQTQDVRMPVDAVCPYTGQTFTPPFVTTKAGHKVAAPVLECPDGSGRRMVSSFGAASGEAAVAEDLPLARNTSEKFELGQRFANKLWNAVRFALSNLEAPADQPDPAEPPTPDQLALADRWVLGRLRAAVAAANDSLREYEFAAYAQGVYDFFWRDLCDWYIEAVKPTIRQSPAQRRVLASCLDASLRLLHPVMPFVTERLWQSLGQIAPHRGLPGLALPPSELLIRAPWPKADATLDDAEARRAFGVVQQVVGAIREVRTTHKVPPRQAVAVSAKAPAALSQLLLKHARLVETLAAAEAREVGPHVERPADAAANVTGDIEVYVHGVVDADAERARLTKRQGELAKSIAMLQGRLGNEKYVSKAPAKLVQETRDQLAAAEREADAVAQQLKAL